MKDSIELLLQTSRIQNRINSNDKKPRSFGTSHLLHQSEIHFIDAIEPGEGINASRLSKKMGITNGAVTQTAEKLISKKLVEKYKVENNKKEVFLRLTSEGETAFTNHRLFHRKLEDRMLEYLDSLNKEQMDALFGLIEIIDHYLPDLNREEKR